MNISNVKTGKWTEQEVTELGAYVPQDYATVEALAEKLGRSKKSVVGKLVSLGVYVAPEKVRSPSALEQGPTKGDILKAIKATGFDIEGLEAATKPALTRVHDFVVSAQ